jgi:hypothetical protein
MWFLDRHMAILRPPQQQEKEYLPGPGKLRGARPASVPASELGATPPVRPQACQRWCVRLAGASCP